jgi:threonyl-tRNA synthetase
MKTKNQSGERLDHRTIAKDLDLYILDEKAGQGLPILLPNWTIIRNLIQNFLREKQNKFGFQEVITPILGSEYLYQTSGHLSHYQDYMFPALSRNNETFYLRPMTCPHHCLIYQQKPRSYRELPFRLCENSLLFRYETSGALKGLERTRWFELADHHIFATYEQLAAEFKKNYLFIAEILTSFGLQISRLVCALHDPHKPEKYHSDENLWNYSENLLINSLNELNLKYVILKGEAAFYGPKLDIEVQAADGKNITLATIQLDFILPQKFGLKYLDKEQKLQTPAIIHHSPIGAYQRFIALLLEQTNGKLPFWLVPHQLAILPLNEEKEVANYWEKLEKELVENNLRVKIMTEKTLNYRIRQVYKKKIPYYLVVGKEEVAKNILKLIFAYSPNREEELKEKELVEKLVKINKV